MIEPDPLSELLPPRRRHRQDFYGPAPLPSEATDMPPGSWGKVLVLAERARRCESLFHPDDAPMPADGTALLLAAVPERRRQRTANEIAYRRQQAADPAFRAAEAARKRQARAEKARKKAAGEPVATRRRLRLHRRRGLLPPSI